MPTSPRDQEDMPGYDPELAKRAREAVRPVDPFDIPDFLKRTNPPKPTKPKQ